MTAYLADTVEALATAVGADMGAANQAITTLQGNDGDLAALTTTAKSNLVAAINETLTAVTGEAAARAAAVTAAAASASTAVAAEATARAAAITAEATARSDALVALKNDILGGAGPAFDTLTELQALIAASGSTAIDALNATAALRVGVDAAQGFTSEQKGTARANIGAADAAALAALSTAVGDTSKDFVSIYQAAKSA